MKGKQLFYTILFFLCISIFSFSSLPSFADDREPKVTRWMHPEQAPKPLHTPPVTTESLILKALTPRQVTMVPPTGQGRICVIIHEDINPLIDPALSRYRSDLIRSGYEVIIYEYASGSAEALRSYLAGLYAEPDSLIAAILIGEIPYIIYELNQDWGDGPGYEDFPCDLFYMDLDGVWSDVLDSGSVQPGNGKYDTRSGNLDLEIWVCRMRTANLSSLGTEAEILNAYFDKNNRYRRGTLKPPYNALVYNDDDWDYMASQDENDLGHVYESGNITTVSDPTTTSASDYKTNHMTASYELIFVRSHGYPGGHGFYTGGSFGWVLCSDYRNNDPVPLFYSFFVCSGSDFTSNDYLAGTVAFNPDDSGLLAWGSTKTGGMWAGSSFYNALGNGKIFGEAFKDWFNTVQGIYLSTTVDKWWYGMVLIGDATLKPKFPPMATNMPWLLLLLGN